MEQLNTKDAHKVFMAFCIKHPETLRLFDVMRENFAEIFPYLEATPSPEECIESVTKERSIEEWKKSADKICDTLKFIINPDDCEKLNEYMYKVVELPNAYSHFKPRDNGDKEYFNRKTFAECLCCPIDEYMLFEGHTCCNRPMSKRSLGKLAFGYDHIYEKLNDSRKIFANDSTSESGFISMFTHRENESVWTKSLKSLAKQLFSSECQCH